VLEIKMNNGKNQSHKSQSLVWLVISQVIRLVGFMLIAYLFSMLFIYWGVSLDKSSRFFFSDRTRLAIIEAQNKGFWDFAFFVLEFDRVPLLTGCAIYFYRLWKQVEKLNSPRE
jgi:hypothetical protein